jgi:small subunit ribosomal protein S20e
MAEVESLPTDKAKTKGGELEDSTPTKIRFTITSAQVKTLESFTSRLVESAKGLNFQVFGPVRMPTRTLRITTRKSPCGNGTNTYDRFEMRVHKRIVTVICPGE